MTRRHGRTTCLFALAAAVVLALAAPSGASAAIKPYTVTISPSLTAAGQNVSVTATFNNLTGPPGGQQIGSANLFWPTAVFPNVTFSVPLPATAHLGTCTFGTVTGSCIQLRNLSVQPSKSFSVTITPTAPTPPCSTAGGVGPGSWFVEAKQSNDFSGPPGNDLTLSSSSQLTMTSTLDGACSLAWNAQPHASLTGQPITSADSFAPGSPISVNFFDLKHNLATGSVDGQLDGPVVTLTPSSNPGAATLGGSSAQASGGIASFGALTINRPGDGYTLSASSGTLPTSAASNQFSVVDKAVPCPKNKSCSAATDNNGYGIGQVVANPTSGTGELTLSVNSNNSESLTCGTYVSADQNVYEFDGPADRSKVGTITITNPNSSGSPTLAGNANQILKAQQICFDGPGLVPFTTASGAPASPDGSGGWIGLLPTCTGSTTGPCHNRQQDHTVPDPLSSPLGFDIVLVADIPAGTGDPHMR